MQFRSRPQSMQRDSGIELMHAVCSSLLRNLNTTAFEVYVKVVNL